MPKSRSVLSSLSANKSGEKPRTTTSNRWVVIVPGFTESQAHFERLIQVLSRLDVSTTVVQPWRQRKLRGLDDGNTIFIGHSMGTYYVAKNDLWPALLVGVLHPILTRQNYFSSMAAIAKETIKQTQISYYMKLRIWNLINLLRYLPLYVWYGPRVLWNSSQLDDDDDVIIIRNQHDSISITENVHFNEAGHHDDILYYPETYLTYIEELLEMLDKP